jgi:FAD/FMN-containing dehydrogenase
MVNDEHCQFGPTMVSEIDHVRSIDQARQILARARRNRTGLAICGARHAAGGQEFATTRPLVDTTSMCRVLDFDRERGLLKVQAGISWRALIAWLGNAQRKTAGPWGILQKQTGNDSLTIGGAVSANVHGDGLKLPPFVESIERFELLMGSGDLLQCSRAENAELFKLAVGGYGNFGLLSSVTLRLVPRRKFERVVEEVLVEDVPEAHARYLRTGAVYGDFQCNIDPNSKSFMRAGVMSHYLPVDDDRVLVDVRPTDEKKWLELVRLAHTDKKLAFELYAKQTMRQSGLVSWAEWWQTGIYIPGYHRLLENRFGNREHASEVITELFVPLDRVAAFMNAVREDLTASHSDLIYSNIRFIEEDKTTFLPWARALSACIVFNLHTEHSTQGLEQCANTMRRLIDHATNVGGRYYLTYHRFASKEQILRCYPEFPQFLQRKRDFDPDELFSSDWYLHYKKMFA